MNEQESMRLRLPPCPTQAQACIRFVVNLVGLWALCALGIYLIGPGEPQQIPPTAVAQLHAASSHLSTQPMRSAP